MVSTEKEEKEILSKSIVLLRAQGRNGRREEGAEGQVWRKILCGERRHQNCDFRHTVSTSR